MTKEEFETKFKEMWVGLNRRGKRELIHKLVHKRRA
jgi:hypothetical protein